MAAASALLAAIGVQGFIAEEEEQIVQFENRKMHHAPPQACAPTH